MSGALDYLTAADAAIVLNYGKAEQAVVKGLNKLSPPGFERQVITLDEFRQAFDRKFLGSGAYNDISYAGWLIADDHDGQGALKQAALNGTKLVGRDLLGFLDYNHFFTTDLANDPSSSMQISGALSGEAGKNDAFPVSGKIVPNGRLAIYTAHMVESATPTLAFVDGAGSNDTITDSASGFITAGFVAGMTLLIFDSTSNDAVNTTITNVAAGVLTLACKSVVSSEAGIEGMEIHGGTI
ncbi:hypothetical protein [Desulforhopalus singaporensis]|uniref:Uncharacterized protein n=1 Tax=Desulforhopalus singaporensis TaxID=91360 RepID=A0A1H0NTK1_9BACT|nr:hypothetical protein [Desulforhopalus singaporensis]SDO95848.1 hypothetical protein SAMN05660330_01434 [Desulforhopalus singaporensis]